MTEGKDVFYIEVRNLAKNMSIERAFCLISEQKLIETGIKRFKNFKSFKKCYYRFIHRERKSKKKN